MYINWPTFKKKFKRDRTVRFPTGTRVFKGFQGSGKTLSMVEYAQRVQKQFPNCKIYSNIAITGLQNFTYIQTGDSATLAQALSERLGARGVLVLLDEAHLFFHKKTGIPLDVLTAISQQRKDRRHLVFSSQIWEELDISLRKQVKQIVNCRCIFGKIQWNLVSDGETLTYDKLQSAYVAKKIRTEIFKHNQELYNSYDTYQKIITNTDYDRPFATQVNLHATVQSQNQKIK